MTVAVNPAHAAHLFTSKTSGQSPALNTANGSVLSDLVHFVSRLSRTLRRFFVSLSLMNGSELNTVPRRFERCGCRLKTKIKFPLKVRLFTWFASEIWTNPRRGKAAVFGSPQVRIDSACFPPY